MNSKKRKKTSGGKHGNGQAIKNVFTILAIALIIAACVIAFKAILADSKMPEAQTSVPQEAGAGKSGYEEAGAGKDSPEKAAHSAPEAQESAQETSGAGGTSSSQNDGANDSAPSGNGRADGTAHGNSGGVNDSATGSNIGAGGTAPSGDNRNTALAPTPPASALDDNTPLMLGNPSDASDKDKNNYLMVKAGYVLSYNASTLTANWAAWHLDKRDLGDVARSNKFRADDALVHSAAGGCLPIMDAVRVKSSDYQFDTYGFDRGHLCPSADRTANDAINSETFLMTNMVPQSPDNNRVAWKSLETYERDEAAKGNELYIFAGVQGIGGESEKGKFTQITLQDGNAIAVPAYTWKVMIILEEGDGDISRINQGSNVAAVMVPNKQGLGKWQKYAVTVDDVEASTGLDFFAVLEDCIEDALEAKKPNLGQ